MIDVTLRYTCDACSKQIINPQEYSVRGGDQLPNAYAPPGTLRGKILCAICTDKALEVLFP